MNYDELRLPVIMYDSTTGFKCTTNHEYEIPGFKDYYYSFRTNKVYTMKKWDKYFRGGLKELTIYRNPPTHHSYPYAEYVYIMRTRDNCRMKMYIFNIQYLIVEKAKECIGLGNFSIPGLTYIPNNK